VSAPQQHGAHTQEGHHQAEIHHGDETERTLTDRGDGASELRRPLRDPRERESDTGLPLQDESALDDVIDNARRAYDSVG